jgi:hypothetical protein
MHAANSGLIFSPRGPQAIDWKLRGLKACLNSFFAVKAEARNQAMLEYGELIVCVAIMSWNGNISLR